MAPEARHITIRCSGRLTRHPFLLPQKTGVASNAAELKR